MPKSSDKERAAAVAARMAELRTTIAEANAELRVLADEQHKAHVAELRDAPRADPDATLRAVQQHLAAKRASREGR